MGANEAMVTEISATEQKYLSSELKAVLVLFAGF
jgi:hypothetical protein